jgi:anti-sigma B factor antagonist
MKLEDQGLTLRVAGIKELGAGNAHLFQDEVRGALRPEQTNIEIDLADMAFIDSCGLGALIALHKCVCSRNGTLRLLNPRPPVMQILQLTRMNHLFEVVKSN